MDIKALEKDFNEFLDNLTAQDVNDYINNQPKHTNMDKSKKALVEQILMLCEKQYRKGAQHAIDTRMTADQASAFRHCDHNGGKAYETHPKLKFGGDMGERMSLRYYADQMLSECSGKQNDLAELLSEYATRVTASKV